MADLTVDKLKVEIDAEMSGIRKDLKRLQRELKNEGEKSANTFGSTFKRALAGLGIAAALKKTFDFAVVAKNAARDAEEISSKFGTIFENVGSKAESVANDLAQGFDLANSTAKELLSTTGDLLVGFGFAEKDALNLSKQVQELAIDVASFSNFAGGAKGASEALTKALLGETESAKSLGIVIRQNTKEFRDQVSELQKTKRLTVQQAKAQVILQQAYEQSQKAVGDYRRTRDSLANTERAFQEQLRETTIAIGQGLSPAFEALIKAGSGWLTLLNKLIGVQKKFLVSADAIDEFSKSLEGTDLEFRIKEAETLTAQLGKLEGELSKLKTKETFLGIKVDEEQIKNLEMQIEIAKRQLDALYNFDSNNDFKTQSAVVGLSKIDEKIEELETKLSGLTDKFQIIKTKEEIAELERLKATTQNYGKEIENASAKKDEFGKILLEQSRVTPEQIQEYIKALNTAYYDLALQKQHAAEMGIADLSHYDIELAKIYEQILAQKQLLAVKQANADAILVDTPDTMQPIEDTEMLRADAIKDITEGTNKLRQEQNRKDLTAAAAIGSVLIDGFNKSGNIFLRLMQQVLNIALAIASAIQSSLGPFGIAAAAIGGVVGLFSTSSSSGGPSSNTNIQSGGIIQPTAPSFGPTVNLDPISQLNRTIQADMLNRQINQGNQTVVIELDGQEVGRGLIPEINKLNKQGFNG